MNIDILGISEPKWMKMGEFNPDDHNIMGFPDSSVGKNLPAMQETPVGFLGWEDPLENG